MRAVLERCDADLLCLQEVSREQCDDLCRWLPGFGHHGQVPRIDLRDPLNSIFFRHARFALIAAGGYWLSEQPQVIGSRSWGSTYPRTAAWVRLAERSNGREMRVTVTHLDNVGALARERQARLLVEDGDVARRISPGAGWGSQLRRRQPGGRVHPGALRRHLGGGAWRRRSRADPLRVRRCPGRGGGRPRSSPASSGIISMRT